MDWMALSIGAVTSLVGSLGFALIFRLSARYLLPASFGGLLAFVVYFVCDTFGMGLFTANLLAAIVGSLYSELLARMMKTPSVEFMIPCIIPLVPGSMLYHTMSHLLAAEYAPAFDSFVKAMMTALGIAAGVIVLSVVSGILAGIAKAKKQ